MKCSLYNPAAFVDLCFLWKPSSGSSPCIATQITSISSSVESLCHLGCCTGTCCSLPGGQVSTCLFVFPTVSLQHPLLCWWARKQQTATPAAQEAPICSASARLLAAATCTKKTTNKKTWWQTPFSSSRNGRLLFRGRHSWRRREEERLLSDAAAVIGFLNATPRTMRLLSRPAIGNLCATAAAWKHRQRTRARARVRWDSAYAETNRKWQRSREGNVCFTIVEMKGSQAGMWGSKVSSSASITDRNLFGYLS